MHEVCAPPLPGQKYGVRPTQHADHTADTGAGPEGAPPRAGASAAALTNWQAASAHPEAQQDMHATSTESGCINKGHGRQMSGRKYYICSSRLGLIRWYDRFRSNRRIQQVKTIVDKVRYTNDILLPHDLLHSAGAIHKQCSILGIGRKEVLHLFQPPRAD